MTKKRSLLLLAGGLIILLSAQILNHIQVQASTEKALTQAFISRHLVGARDLKVSLERGMGLGKPLSLFSGTDRLFDSIQSRYEGTEFLALTSTGLEAWAVTKGGEPILAQLTADKLVPFASVLDPQKSGDYRTVVQDKLVLISLPLYLNKDLKGLVWLGFPRDQIQKLAQTEAENGLILVGLTCVVSLLVYILLFGMVTRGREDHNIPLGRISLVIVGLLGLTVVGYTVASSFRLVPSLVQLYERNAAQLTEAQALEYTKLSQWDIAPSHWKNAELQLAAQIRNTPEIKLLAILGPDRQPLFAADHQGTWAWTVPDAEARKAGFAATLAAASVVAVPPDKPAFHVAGAVDRGFMDSIFLDRLLDALTVTLVSLIFSIELLLALGLLVRVQTDKPSGIKVAVEPVDSERGVKIIRFTAFLFFMAELLPLPFMPLFISDLYARSPLLVFQLSADAVKGLPFSAHLLGVLVFIPVIGALSSRFSLRSLFLVSGGFLLAGNLLAAFSPDLGFLMGYRLLSGMGYGGVLAASTGLVIQTTTKEHRTSGFAAWGAGFAAASICAIVLGGLLVTYLGYRNGMLVAAGMSVVLGIFGFLFHPAKPPKFEDQTKVPFRFSDLFAPFRDRNTLVTLLFASIPVQLAFFGLFQYTLPLAMNEVGISEANIGRILTIYGILSLAAPLLGRLADRTRKERLMIIIGNLITGVVLMTFFVTSGLWPIIFVVAAIGIGGLLFDTVISSYLSMTKISEKQGETKFLSVFLTWEKLFTVFIPVLVGTLMSAVGYFQSAALLGIVITVGALVFALFSRTPRK